MATGSSWLTPEVVVGAVCAVLLCGRTSVAAESQILPTTETPPNATCPGEVFTRVQDCLKKTGVMLATLQSVANPAFTPSFCGTPENATLDCLQDKLDICAENPPRLALLKLQVDPQRSHGNLQYFCQNRHVLQREVNCTRFIDVSMCIRRAAGKLRDVLALGVSEFKPVLDTQCLYNDDLLECLAGSMDSDTCNGTSQLYKHLTQAMRFPYCDLTKLEQHVRLHHALSLRGHHHDQHEEDDRNNTGSGAPRDDSAHGSHGHETPPPPPPGSGSDSAVVCADSVRLGRGVALVTAVMFAWGWVGGKY